MTLPEVMPADDLVTPSDCAERRLWRLVVLQTIEDATRHALGLGLLHLGKETSDDTGDGHDALRMIRTGSPDWHTLCELADLPGDLLRLTVLDNIRAGQALSARTNSRQAA